MLVSHEVPISLLETSKQFNDYDYCLLHLTYDFSEYRKFYIDSVKNGRKVLLDNSLFELGDSLTNVQLAQGVLDINPTWYVVPDCLNNCDETINRFKSFKKDYPNLPGLAIGVVQGSTLDELVKCYKYMSKYADKIAIPFDSKGFGDLVYNKDILEQWCQGRYLFIKHLIDNKIWNHNKPHHLLGCSYAKEFSNNIYNNLNIESVDTSNPVVAGICNLKYEKNGLKTKPSVKLCDLITCVPSQKQLELINYNVYKFKEIFKYYEMDNFF